MKRINWKGEWQIVGRTVVHAYCVLMLATTLVSTLNPWIAQPLSRAWLLTIVVAAGPLFRLGQASARSTTTFLAKLALGTFTIVVIAPGVGYAVSRAMAMYPEPYSINDASVTQLVTILGLVFTVGEVSFRVASRAFGFKSGLFEWMTPMSSGTSNSSQEV